jgi:hypothetical protein
MTRSSLGGEVCHGCLYLSQVFPHADVWRMELWERVSFASWAAAMLLLLSGKEAEGKRALGTIQRCPSVP